MKKTALLFMAFLVAFLAKADEGMWLLMELNRQSIAKMKELGFKFPVNKIYSETNPSLKDAVVIFGGGCTGVVVSEQGLIFTNHHCGYGDIQKLSSVEHDYLKDGFVSQSFSEELPAKGLSIQFLQKAEDVSEFVTSALSPDDNEETRYRKIDSLSQVYLEKYKDNEFLRADIIPFYSDNKYYVVVYEIFRDVRLVFTPPSSVGKYGDETDNWTWPRHTGDFSVFRVYANKDNKAANYSPDNIPYKPKYSIPVSIKGYKEKDYAMTIGYPGSTERYMSSWGITQMVESEHKPRIKVRGAKQEIWREAMNASDAIRIKYASKYAGSSNYWKNAMGMNEAIAKLHVIQNKEGLESEFANWVTKSNNQSKYGEVLSMMKEGYTSTMESARIRTYLFETFYMGMEITRIANTALFINRMDDANKEEELKGRLTNTYKDYEPSLDKKVMPALLKIYAENVPAGYLPSIYDTIEKEFGGDYKKYAEWFYNNTNCTSLEGIINLITSENGEKIKNDPAMILAWSLQPILMKLQDASSLISKGERLYMAGLMEMQPKKTFYPDANFTQRLSYGSIESYIPADAVHYDYYTTSQGVLDKYISDDPEFDIQQYIREDLTTGDFGRYADKDGKMHVNFLSNNDITGGNSGSPVFNGNAELIGLAFDGNWESLSGDILFNPEVQRCINVDIRYVLYIIDKVMKCPRIINELKIVK